MRHSAASGQDAADPRFDRPMMRTRVLLPLLACLAGCTGGDVPIGTPGDALAYEFGACAADLRGGYGTGPVRSLHVPMRDGVRIALDVVLPDGIAEGERVPTLLVMTRYWRATENAEAHPLQQFFTRHGYAVVYGDVRGTGASFGAWPHHRARDETLDFGEIIDWIAAQPWSDGQVAGGGVSYSANTADWMVERGTPTPSSASRRRGAP